MAKGSFNLNRTGPTSSYINFTCNWESVSNGAGDNTSTVKITIVASKSAQSGANTYGNYIANATVDGTTQSVESTKFTLKPGGAITLLNKSYTVQHNPDGTKTVNISASVGGNVMFGSGSQTVRLDNIPLYTDITQTLNNKTETSISMNWNSDHDVDFVWYSIDNGNNWVAVDVTDGKSGTYTINGLVAGVTYKIKTRARRKDSQLTTDSATLEIDTYPYPFCNSAPSFTIGEKLTLGIFNPLNRNVIINIFGADGSQISNDATTGNIISGYNSEDIQNKLYDSIPTAISGIYTVKITYLNHVQTTQGGTYKVNENVCKPTIGNISYQDTNPTTLAITNNNQQIIRNQSTAQFLAENLTGYKNATIITCDVVINANTYNMIINGNNASIDNIGINSAQDITATVIITDSRGLTASKDINVIMLDWELPSAVIHLKRQSNYYSSTDLNVNAMFSSIDSKNTLTIQARYKKTIDSSYTSFQTLQNGVTTVLTLNNSYDYDVQVVLTDLFGTKTYNLNVYKGMPIVYISNSKKSVGINCFPSYSNSLEINGRIVSTNPVQLYSNSSGTTGTITLSITSSNFSRLIIYYVDADGAYNSTELHTPSGKVFTLSTAKILDSNNAMYINSALVTVSGTSITWRSERGYMRFNTSGNTPHIDSNRIKIFRVMGFYA